MSDTCLIHVRYMSDKCVIKIFTKMGMKMTLSPLYETASGKPCKNSATVVMTEHKTGKVRAYDRHEAKQPNSAAQQAVKAEFVERQKVASAWWKINKPQKDAPKSSWTADYRRLDEVYQGQRQFNSRWQLLCACVTKEKKIVIGGQEVTNFVPDQEGLG